MDNWGNSLHCSVSFIGSEFRLCTAKATQHSQSPRKRFIIKIGPLGCRGLLKSLETNPGISLLHLYWITPWYIFSSCLISLLLAACMDLDLLLRCSHKLEHEAQM